jgi:hypothetical protein
LVNQQHPAEVGLDTSPLSGVMMVGQANNNDDGRVRGRGIGVKGRAGVPCFAGGSSE